jgi:hypothetical protein
MAALGFAALGVEEVAAQEAAHIGEIKFGAYSTCPPGWVEANGQTLPIEGNELLFAVIGTAYGGDGETNFAVPNVQGVVSAPVVVTPMPDAPQGIQQQEIKQQPARRQKIRRHDVKGSPLSGRRPVRRCLPASHWWASRRPIPRLLLLLRSHRSKSCPSRSRGARSHPPRNSRSSSRRPH